MDKGTLIILFWVLPALITFLLFSDSSRRVDLYPMEKWEYAAWAAFIVLSVVWPLGFIGWIYVNSGSLTKERTFKSK